MTMTSPILKPRTVVNTKSAAIPTRKSVRTKGTIFNCLNTVTHLDVACKTPTPRLILLKIFMTSSK